MAEQPKQVEYFLERMTAPELKAALRRTQTCILGGGCLEQHGYHLPLGTDSLTADALSKEAGRKAGCLVAPPLFYSYSGMPFSINMEPSLFEEQVFQIGRSLIGLGIKRLVLWPCHGDAKVIKAWQTAATRLTKKFPKVKIAVPVAWEMVDEWWLRCQRDGDWHAGNAETSLVLHIFPNLVKDQRPQDPPRKPEPIKAIPKSEWRKRYLYPRPPQEPVQPTRKYWVAGDPNKASKTLGKQLFEGCVEAVVEVVRMLEKRR